MTLNVKCSCQSKLSNPDGQIQQIVLPVCRCHSLAKIALKFTVNFLAECKLQCPLLHSLRFCLKSNHVMLNENTCDNLELFHLSHTLDVYHLHAANIFTRFFINSFRSEIKARQCNYYTVWMTVINLDS
jgi:hypothetical protein